MPYNLDDKLVIGISSRALFDLDEANDVYEKDGLEAYRAYQREHENTLLNPGTGFPLVRSLLGINELSEQRLVEVVLISRNDAESGLRIFNSIQFHALDIPRAAFTDGRDAGKYLESFSCDLFLSAHERDVRAALKAGHPAALVYPPPKTMEKGEREVRIAFDGDAVLFSDESERIFREQGLEAFQQNEAQSENIPLNPGPFKGFLDAIVRIQNMFPEQKCPIRTALVTARIAPAHKRAVKTLRAWGVRVDESFFLGGIEKAKVLRVFRPHIYFDDQKSYLETAAPETPAALVPT